MLSDDVEMGARERSPRPKAPERRRWGAAVAAFVVLCAVYMLAVHAARRRRDVEF